MIPKTPSSSDGSFLPPRLRASKSNFIKDSTEQDLWAFDEPSQPEKESAVEVPTSDSLSGMPAPRGSGKVTKLPVGDFAIFEESSQAAEQETAERVQMNVSKKRPKSLPTFQSAFQPASQQMRHSEVGSEFDDLDDWEAPRSELEVLKAAPEAESVSVSELAQAKPVIEKIMPETPRISSIDEFSPQVRKDAVPVSLYPHLKLSKIERIGLAALLAVILVGAGVVYFKTIHHLPFKSERVQENDFPVKGEHLMISSAASYWRAPIADGVHAETFRRGTQLVPVVELTMKGGPAAVRVIFRNSNGEVIGDAVTRTIQAGNLLTVAGTAGFEDLGMHAAYRTEQSKPWTVQIYEAPSENSPGPAFKKLFEMNISTDHR